MAPRRRAGRRHAGPARSRPHPRRAGVPAHARRPLLPRSGRRHAAGSPSRSRRRCGTWSPAGSSPPTGSAACARSSAPASGGRGAPRGPGRASASGGAARARAAAKAAGRSCRRRRRRRRRRRDARARPSPSSSWRAGASCSATCVARETLAVSWREILWAFRRLEARGTIRGGRFVTGFVGEQYALPEAVEGLRETRRRERTGEIVRVAAVDPLNLVGILTPGPRVPAVRRNAVVYHDGVPVPASGAAPATRPAAGLGSS